jgi:drug/metabolite transporter (DMT)-like permease
MVDQTSVMSSLPERNVLAAFLMFILAVGGASVAMQITFVEMAPFWVSTSRFLFGAVIFWVIVLIRKLPLPTGRALFGAILFGALTIGFSLMLATWALTALPASLYQILTATVPLLTVFLSAMHGVESITRRALIGALITIFGVVVTVGGGVTSDLSLPHVGAVLLASVLLAEGGVLIKKFPPNPPVMTNAVGMTTGAIIIGTASLIKGESWTLPTQPNTIVAFVYLAVIVTVVAFMMYMYVLNKWTASGTSYGFVIVPLITMVVAAILLGEKITLSFVIGAVLVLAGVYVGALLPSKQKPSEVEECKDRAGQVLPRCV